MDTLPLHDCLSLGEVELGLSSKSTKASLEEVHRLPILLRLLSSSRPLSSIPSFPPRKDADSSSSVTAEKTDAVIQEAVDRLEDRAAVYSSAEGIEVVTSFLAPFVCRKLAKLPSLKRAADGVYNTEELAVLAANPVSSRLKKRRRKKGESGGSHHRSAAAGTAASDDETETSEDEMEVAGTTTTGSSPTEKKQRQASIGEHNSSVALSGEDSQEATVTKTLSELATLVVQSLKPIKKKENDDAEGGGGGGGRGSDSSALSLTVDDSILAEAGHGRSNTNITTDLVGGAMAGSDLASTVAALMHHAPVLRHGHVASALCRAAVPQAPDLISRMGANCPAAVPCLLGGCIDVYKRAAENSNHLIASSAKEAILALANLSDREAGRVRMVLRAGQICVDVQLQLDMRLDPLAAACLLIEHLSVLGRNGVVAVRGSCRSPQRDLFRSKAKTEKAATASTHTLVHFLEENQNLLADTFVFLGRELDKSSFPVGCGRTCLFLSAFVWVTLCHPLENMGRNDGVTEAFTTAMKSLSEFIPNVQKAAQSQGTVHQEGETILYRPFALCLCVSIVALARTFVPGEEASDGDSAERRLCVGCLKALFSIPEFSLKSSVLASRVACAMESGDGVSVRCLVEEIVSEATTPVVSRRDMPCGRLDEQLSRACKWASLKGNLDLSAVVDRGLEEDAFVVDQSAVKELIRGETTTGRAEKVKNVLKACLHDSAKCSSMVLRPSIPSFVVESVSFVLKMDGPKIPLVLPVQIDMLATGIQLHGSFEFGNKESQFLLQLLYCFAFLEKEPTSPFVFDPRSLPLAEIYGACETLPPQCSNSGLLRKLKSKIARYCPEIPDRARQYMMLKTSPHIVAKAERTSPKKTKAALMKVLRKSVADQEGDSSDRAEKEFILASEHLNEADLYTCTASALLSEPKSLSFSYTYSNLCKDPLVLLKCPLCVWRRKGLRRVLLYVLSSLLDTNDLVVKQYARDNTADEFIASRNELLVRCIATAVGQHNGNQTYCPMTVNLVRKYISSQKGLVAMLLKQKLSEQAFDWLVEFVPETMEDAGALSSILSERSSLSPAERLVAADSVLRIAIVHGHRNPQDAEALVYSALTQFISSFFLIVGPVGVPVSSLGQDTTQVSRRATFRMLQALLRVRGYRPRVRNECILALQKLAGLCKGEGIVSGVPGSVANRQKNLLKELLDAIIRSANAMGAGMQS